MEKLKCVGIVTLIGTTVLIIENLFYPAVFAEEYLPPPVKPDGVVWIEGEDAALTNIRGGHEGWTKDIVDDETCYNGKILSLYLGGETGHEGYYAYYDVNVPLEGYYELLIASSGPNWTASSRYYYAIDGGEWISSEKMQVLSEKWGPCGLVAWTRAPEPSSLTAGLHKVKFKVIDKRRLEQPPSAFIWALDAFCLVKSSLSNQISLLSLESNKSGNLFLGGENPKFNLKLLNGFATEKSIKIFYQVSDYLNQICYTDDSLSVNIPPGQSKLDIEITQVKSKGYYRFLLQVYDDGKEKTGEITTSFAVLFPLLPGKIENSPFGVCWGFWGLWDPAKIDYCGGIARMAGIKWDRDANIYMWWAVEPYEKGKFDWQNPDLLVGSAARLEMGIIGSLGHCPRWASDAPMQFKHFGDMEVYRSMPRDIKDWEDYVEKTVSRYKDKIKIWQIMNEPNGLPSPMSPENYTKLLKVAYTIIKKINPEATVLGCTTSFMDYEFIEGVLNAGGGSYMDVVSVHPYMCGISSGKGWCSPEEGGFSERINNLYELLAKYKFNRRIWITEVSWPTHLEPADEFVNDLEQAQYLIRLYVQSLALGIEKIFWHRLWNGPDRTTHENTYGLVNYDGSPRISLVAYSVLSHVLENAVFKKQVKLTDNSLYLYLFEKGQGSIAAVWNASGADKSITLQTDAQTVNIVNMIGGSREVKPVEKTITIAATENPVFLEWKGNVCEPLETAYKLTSSVLPIIIGTKEQINLEVKNPYHKILKGEVIIEAPEGVVVEPEKISITLQEGERQNYPFTIFMKSIKITGDIYNINFNIDEEGISIGSLGVSVYNIFPLEIARIIPGINQDGTWTVGVNIRSSDKSDISNARISLIFPEGLTANPKEVLLDVLRPGEETTAKFTLAGTGEGKGFDPGKCYEVVAEVKIGQGGCLNKSQVVDFQTCRKADEAINIDGNLSDWKHIKPIVLDRLEQIGEIKDWKGPDDLSAEIYSAWDDDCLYLAVKVKDDNFVQPYERGEAWQGDSVQIALDPNYEKKKSTDYYEYMFTLTPEKGFLVWHYRKTPPAALAGVSRQDYKIKLAIKRDNQYMIYEAAIPWSNMGYAACSGNNIGFSLLVNDNDGTGRRGWIEWFSGIGKTKDPSLYGDLLLKE